MEFKEYKIDNFLEDLASDLASPGGGSVAGLVSALAASLNSMVYSLTVNKKSFEKQDIEVQKTVLDFKEASSKFIKRAMILMENDREYFNKLMDCYKLPKDTEEEKAKRQKEIAEKTLGAIKAPYDLAKESYAFYDNIDIAVKYGNKMLLSDASCAAILLNAAIECAIVNVRINLASIKNESYVNKIEEELKNIEKLSIERKQKIQENINKAY
ncbi:MAG: cyclodeaminase/cyclohydrolase family protein [Clostridium sp.]|nr:cyclodeaminase/cyclohydrolase family protein [Clostridium sp.]MDY3827882.1 cyclodeaminase/cyclohydrolase family protein [Clostridium sp.]